jgi:type I restriction enzyme, S subunit
MESSQVAFDNEKLPDGWRRVRLGDVCDIVARQVDPTLPQYGSLPHVNGENIISGLCRLAYLNTAEEENMTSGKYFFEAGDVLYSKLRPYLRKAVVAEVDGVCSADMYPIKVNRTVLDPHFAAWLFVSDEFTNYADGESRRARMPKLNREQLFAFSAALPPLDEQKRIVQRVNERMAAVERARAAAQAQLDALNLFVTAVLRESQESDDAKELKIGDCATEVTRGIGSRWKEFPVMGAMRAGLAPAKEGVGKSPERYKPVTSGTIFYNPMRILLGSIAMIDEDDAPGITSPDYVVFHTTDGILHYRWFYYWLRSPYGEAFIKSLTRGAVRERLLFKRLAEAVISVPPWPTQILASERLKQVAPIRRNIQTQLNAINRLPTSLLREVFGGRF